MHEQMHEQRHILRMLAEMLILFASLLAIDHGLLSGEAFADVNPNPYWLPVLIMAMSYGTGMGLAAAFAATMIWLAAPHGRADGVDDLEMQVRLSLLPMLWMGTGLAIGEVTASRKARIAEQERRYHVMERNWERMADTFKRLAKINRTLQIRIATEQRAVGQAISAATGLADSDPANQLNAVARLIALAAQTEDFTCFDVQGSQVVARFRGKAAKRRPSDLSRTNLGRHMIANPALLHADRVADRKILARLGIVALPIRNDDDGPIAALLVIHASRRLRLTDAKIAELSYIAQSLGRLPVMFAGGTAVQAGWNVVEGKVA